MGAPGWPDEAAVGRSALKARMELTILSSKSDPSYFFSLAASLASFISSSAPAPAAAALSSSFGSSSVRAFLAGGDDDDIFRVWIADAGETMKREKTDDDDAAEASTEEEQRNGPSANGGTKEVKAGRRKRASWVLDVEAGKKTRKETKERR
mmetsp:Transcript_37023/g.110875  ORF Transcript_37023/g.110875 Transcript_37023/m.110875 type:complete len:152 (-) Transcript_37023:111-566(-)